MTTSLVERIVGATLYEGYILYPYRPTSVKNQVRWTFGGVFPPAYGAAGGERTAVQTECLLRGDLGAAVHVSVRFLHPMTRTVLRLREPVPHAGSGDVAGADPVPSLDVAGTRHVTWDEATERTIDAGSGTIDALLAQPWTHMATFAAAEELDPLRDESGMVVAVTRRAWERLDVAVEVSVERCSDSVLRLRVRIANVTGVDPVSLDRQAAVRRALVSTHAVLEVEGGAWLSLADPPEDCTAFAAASRNDGLWPVLVGDGAVDAVLASPIILEDHPQVAPESPGDLFDATEIDEILSLRILSLTDDEKAEMRSADQRARALLDRTESLTQEQFMQMHGTIREPRPTIGRPG